MPIFEFVCDDCGTSFEKLVRRSDAVACPSCGEDHVQQQYSTFAARSNGQVQSPAMDMGGGCPAGMCGNPGMCGRN